MLKKMYLVPLVLSLAALLVIADSAHAQRRGGGWGGGYGRGYGGGWGGGNNWQSYVAPFIGGGYYGNNYYGSGGYYSGYGRGYYGNAWDSPYYSGYRSGYYYPSTSYVVPSYDYSYAPSYNSYQSSYTPTQSTPTNAQIRVLVPDAQTKVTFDGNPTQQTGTERWFYTPNLQAGANNTYRIRATWMMAGREMSQERVVNVNPGQSVTVEFTQTAGDGQPNPPIPLPKKTDANPTLLDGRVIRTGPDHFVIQSPNQGEMTIYTNPQTRYLMNNNPGAFTDIRVGSNVNFGFTMQGDRRFANTITIRP
jgi:uncharacterized protein (TIGR03000 family)